MYNKYYDVDCGVQYYVFNNYRNTTVSGSFYLEKIIHAYQTTEDITTTVNNTITTNTSNQKTITDLTISNIFTGETTTNKTDFLITPISFLLIVITIFIRRRKEL